MSASIAVDVSAFLIAKVPPNPQQVSALSNSTSVRPRMPQQLQRLVADAQQPQRVARRVVGDPVRVAGADITDAEHVDKRSSDNS